jgi:hypothetical protein
MACPPQHYLVSAISCYSLEGQEGDVIEDSEPSELQGKIKDLVELSMREW